METDYVYIILGYILGVYRDNVKEMETTIVYSLLQGP